MSIFFESIDTAVSVVTQVKGFHPVGLSRSLIEIELNTLPHSHRLFFCKLKTPKYRTDRSHSMCSNQMCGATMDEHECRVRNVVTVTPWQSVLTDAAVVFRAPSHFAIFTRRRRSCFRFLFLANQPGFGFLMTGEFFSGISSVNLHVLTRIIKNVYAVAAT